MEEIKDYPPYLDYPKPRKPQTNAQKIRAMSDDELATHLHDIGWDCHLCAEHRRLDNEPLLRGEKCDEKCAEHCLQWLQKPAEIFSRQTLGAVPASIFVQRADGGYTYQSLPPQKLIIDFGTYLTDYAVFCLHLEQS